ncbi:hypothetical protein BHM03_00051154 [Ensete ventricosum]|nr:hypothetical protein BHM03_00051154 [Ensete ventricosum]
MTVKRVKQSNVGPKSRSGIRLELRTMQRKLTESLSKIIESSPRVCRKIIGSLPDVHQKDAKKFPMSLKY